MPPPAAAGAGRRVLAPDHHPVEGNAGCGVVIHADIEDMPDVEVFDDGLLCGRVWCWILGVDPPVCQTLGGPVDLVVAELADGKLVAILRRILSRDRGVSTLEI